MSGIKCRKETFKDIIEHVQLVDVMIGEKCNKDIDSNEVQHFLQNYKFKTGIKLLMEWIRKD